LRIADAVAIGSAPLGEPGFPSCVPQHIPPHSRRISRAQLLTSNPANRNMDSFVLRGTKQTNALEWDGVGV